MNSPLWTIRRATRDDLPAVHAQVQATYVPWQGRLPEASIFNETLADVAASFDAGPMWVASDSQGQVLASGRAEVLTRAGSDNRFVELHRLAVLPHTAGQGLGAMMMEMIEAYALLVLADEPQAVLELEVRVAQPQAQSFYERRGYRFVSIAARHRDGSPRTVRLRKVLRPEGER
jgi:ribosomal protein S18 acetylase RimI-like enzyme